MGGSPAMLQPSPLSLLLHQLCRQSAPGCTAVAAAVHLSSLVGAHARLENHAGSSANALPCSSSRSCTSTEVQGRGNHMRHSAQQHFVHHGLYTASSPSPALLRSTVLENLSNNWPSQYQRYRHCRWLAETEKEQLSPVAMSPVNISLTQERGSDVRMDSQVIFDSCWRRFEEKYRLNNVRVPREVVWLNGAPGAGKGANSKHILKTRGLEHTLCISSLLSSHPDVRELVNRGEMIPDTMVGDVLLEALLIKSTQSPEWGVLVDGFPRTALQVDFLKLLYDKLTEMHSMWAGTPYEPQFPRPLFKVVMLYVNEETSIQRQMDRAKVASVYNKRVMDAGAGELWEQRATDLSVETCKKRYAIFKQHYTAILRLKQFFPFHLIDAMGTLSETQEAITTELRYQSSLDLSEATYNAIRHLPLSRDITAHARQQLVSRLDDHCEKHPHLFQKVIDIIAAEIMPLLKESGMGGEVDWHCELRMFNDHPRAGQILIDVLTDRGFNAVHIKETVYIPVQLDLTTGAIRNRKETIHRFRMSWDSRNVRDLAKAQMTAEIATRMAETVQGDSVRISQSFIPTKPAGKNISGRQAAAVAAAAAVVKNQGGLGVELLEEVAEADREADVIYGS